ncbi:MAG: endo-1,4-beta-xylanase [Chloroflexi bacterium]|nr:endo-1,4-beta-xylanase [Chloroflexota bacterium]
MGRDQPADTADRTRDCPTDSSSPFSRRFSRRQLMQGAGALAAAMVLGEACGPSATSKQTSEPSIAATPANTFTPPSPVPAATPTPTPANSSPPDTMLKSALASYAKAMGVLPNGVQVASRIITETSGATFTALVTPDGTPLLLRDAEAGWIEATLAPLATKAGVILETMMQVTRQENGTWVDLTMNSTYVGLITGNANHIYTSGELDMIWVFGEFTTAHWNQILANWPRVLAQLRDGAIPSGYPYNWQGIDRLRGFASARNLPLRAFHLVWGDDIPSTITSYGASDLKKILEFTVRVRLLYCPDISVWNIGDEILARSLYLQDATGGLWPQLFGAPQIVAFVGKIVREVNPKAILVVTEDMPLEATFPDPRFSRWYLTYLQQIQDQGIEIGWADIENNFWVYDPPDLAKIDRVLGQIKALGIKTITSEMTVTVSPLFPSWPSRPKTVATVRDPVAVQALLYGETVAAYLRHRTGAFGTGGVWDEIAWQNSIGHPEAHAMMYDTAGDPKPAVYALRRQLLASLSLGV